MIASSDLKPGGVVVCSKDDAGVDRRLSPDRLIDPGLVAGGRLRLPAGCAAGVKPTVDPVKRIMVNVGSAPSATGRWWRPVRRDVR